MKFDISGLLVKTKEHDSKIDTNKENISDNLSLINSKFEDNKSNIAENLKLIGEKSDIIEDNKSNISNNYNFTQINKKKSEFNTSLIDINIENLKSIKNDIENYYKLKNFIIFDIVNNINRAINVNSPKFIIAKNDIVYNFKKGSYIECNLSILILFVLHYMNIQFFHILLECFDDQNVMFKEIKLPLIGIISKHCILTNSCVIKMPKDFEKIYFKLSIVLNNIQRRNDIVKILEFDNHMYFKIFEK